MSVTNIIIVKLFMEIRQFKPVETMRPCSLRGDFALSCMDCLSMYYAAMNGPGQIVQVGRSGA